MEPTTPPPAPTETQQEDLSLILKIVSFCIPLVGAFYGSSTKIRTLKLQNQPALSP